MKYGSAFKDQKPEQASDWCFIFTLSQLLLESVSEETLSG